MEPIIAILVVFLILFIIFWAVGKFISGVPYQIIGIILGIIFLVYALQRLNIGGSLKL